MQRDFPQLFKSMKLEPVFKRDCFEAFVHKKRAVYRNKRLPRLGKFLWGGLFYVNGDRFVASFFVVKKAFPVQHKGCFSHVFEVDIVETTGKDCA